MNPSRVAPLDFDSWTPAVSAERSDALCRELESGEVLFFPGLPFELMPAEQRFLSERWAAEGSKNIALRPGGNEVRGARGEPADLAGLQAMLARYARMTEALVRTLFARYGASLESGATSFRPCSIAGRALSARRDDQRLHVDSFPSNPVHGKRILRVFSNVDPAGGGRTWNIGVPFKEIATRFVPGVPAPLPGSSWILHKLGITKSRRSAYDHYMLRLHDAAKDDEEFQRTTPRETFSFPALSTWIVFTDQVVHAATSGQYAFEQTFYVAAKDMAARESAPLAVLEQLVGRPLA
jgi:3-deoxy-D-manno-octulosonic acid hydroxylase-like protein